MRVVKGQCLWFLTHRSRCCLCMFGCTLQHAFCPHLHQAFTARRSTLPSVKPRGQHPRVNRQHIESTQGKNTNTTQSASLPPPCRHRSPYGDDGGMTHASGHVQGKNGRRLYHGVSVRYHKQSRAYCDQMAESDVVHEVTVKLDEKRSPDWVGMAPPGEVRG
jgi:hypothetical protein